MIFQKVILYHFYAIYINNNLIFSDNLKDYTGFITIVSDKLRVAGL